MTRLREADGVSREKSGSDQTFETAGSPVAYMDAPEFFQIVAEAPRA